MDFCPQEYSAIDKKRNMNLIVVMASPLTDRGLAQFCGGGRRSRTVSYKTSLTSGISRHKIALNPMMADSGS